MFRRKLNVPIFDAIVYVGVTENLQDYYAKYGIKDDDNTGYDAVAIQVDDSENKYELVFVNTEPHVIVHECVHLKNYIFKHIGFALSIDNDEIEALFVDWLFKEISNIVNNRQ